MWNDAPQIGVIIVNRTPQPSSASIAEIELGIPIFGVIPPAQDVCGPLKTHVRRWWPLTPKA